MRPHHLIPILVLLLFASPALADPPVRHGRAADGPVRVFLDCAATYCDFDYYRSEITFVDWVRTREDADVHVLVTSQRTGSGGLEYTLNFIGQDRFSGENQVLSHATVQTQTPDEVRREFGRVLALGLVRYVAATRASDRLRVVEDRGTPSAPPASARADDPWNLWVFRTRVSTELESESAYEGSALSGFLSANRTTEAWKINLSAHGRYREATYDLGEDEEPYTTVTRNTAARALVVKSLTDRWSAGVRSSVSSSTFVNQQFTARAAPAVEFNIFPYSESTRRRLTLEYSVGVRHFDYYEETVFGLIEETRWDHSFEGALDLKQPWGTINTALEFSQYFFDPGKYRVEYYNWLDVRLFRGLSVNVNANASVIRNQIYLPRGEASLEEILVRQRQLATSYRYEVSLGLSYTFGSIFNNVVNRRFGG